MDVNDILNRIGGIFDSSSYAPTNYQTGGKERMRIDSNGNASFPNWQDVLMNEMDKRMITIRNPETLNGNVPRIAKGWNIEYMGRDLSLDVDNYRWDVWSDYNTARGYWIIERELVMGDWLNVRWGLTPTNVKERKELIDKSRLKDKSRIQSDMIQAINSLG
jgi:hypothetical protein